MQNTGCKWQCLHNCKTELRISMIFLFLFTKEIRAYKMREMRRETSHEMRNDSPLLSRPPPRKIVSVPSRLDLRYENDVMIDKLSGDSANAHSTIHETNHETNHERIKYGMQKSLSDTNLTATGHVCVTQDMSKVYRLSISKLKCKRNLHDRLLVFGIIQSVRKQMMLPKWSVLRTRNTAHVLESLDKVCHNDVDCLRQISCESRLAEQIAE